jgi:CubicO group peptidase (beta-lactamase class C family)
MKQVSNILAVYLVLAILHPVLRADELPSERPLYFPPAHGQWEIVKPEQVGWDGALLQKALDYAAENQSSGVVILHKGRILAEQYFEIQGEKTAKYPERVLARDKSGRAIEDVASVQKSVASILVGIAQQKGLLRIDDRVSQHLSVGWSRATPQQENAITIRHLITVTGDFPVSSKVGIGPTQLFFH